MVLHPHSHDEDLNQHILFTMAEQEQEEDYLSDKFLASLSAADTKQPKTYAEKRKAALRTSEARNVANRMKSRKEREEESREEGLGTSLFERAKEDDKGGMSKALGLMRRMGYVEGDALGAKSVNGLASEPQTVAPVSVGTNGIGIGASAGKPSANKSLDDEEDATGGDLFERRGLGAASSASVGHRKLPLAVEIRSGKKGLGLGKRAISPGVAERVAKVLKSDESAKHESFRERSRGAFEERKTSSQLENARRTLASLDEKAGAQLNVLSLDSQDPTTFPPELLEAFAPTVYDPDLPAASDANGFNLDPTSPAAPTYMFTSSSDPETAERLREQMQRDKLQPLNGTQLGDGNEIDNDNGKEGGLAMGQAGSIDSVKRNSSLSLALAMSDEAVAEARAFLQLPYDDKDDLDGNCPGEDEEAHD